MAQPGTYELINWRELPSSERRQWWEQRWLDAIALKERYRLPLGSGWWEHPIAVEAIEAYSSWIALYDTGSLNDPQGKLDLLWQLEHLASLLRGGERPFDPARDRPAYEQHLRTIDGKTSEEPADPRNRRQDTAGPATGAALELPAIDERLAELAERERGLQQATTKHAGGDVAQARRDLDELKHTQAHLHRRRHELRSQSEETEAVEETLP